MNEQNNEIKLNQKKKLKKSLLLKLLLFKPLKNKLLFSNINKKKCKQKNKFDTLLQFIEKKIEVNF